MKTLEGSVAIVAGAATGIGRDIAVALSGEGAQIAIADCKPADDLVRELGQDQAFSGICDGRSPQRVNEFVGEVISRFGTVDILVNSPTWAKHAALADLDDAAIESALSRGPAATLYFMRACYPHLVGGGRVINVPSCSEAQGDNGFSTHIAANATVGGITWALAREWGPHGITVNAVCPVAVSHADRGEATHRGLLEGILHKVCIPRDENVRNDIGRAVTYLAGPHTGGVTGCALMVNYDTTSPS